MYRNEVVEPETRKGKGNRKKLRGTFRGRKVAGVSRNGKGPRERVLMGMLTAQCMCVQKH